ncbi:MAG: mechanosensitive ion channel family protein, partial [candidate division WOR-3 bacterium]|nr:mechanosensitive ion channel family protein [candidate division WOR-3 bacterium]
IANIFNLIANRVQYLKKAKMAIIYIILTIGFHVGIFFFDHSTKLYSYMKTASEVFYILSVTWLVMVVLSLTVRKVIIKKTEAQSDDITYQIIGLLEKVIFIIFGIIGISMALNAIGVNVVSLVTGLGIGGLAVALAAQDLFSNIIGGITIFTSKIINVQDFVTIADKDGTVKQIGLRTTKIEMLNGREVIIPNNKIMQSIVINYSRGNTTLINYVIGLTYASTVEDLKKGIGIIEKVLKDDDRIPNKNRITVGFYKFDSFSLNIYINFFVKKNSDIGAIKQDFHFKVKEQFDKEGLGIAFPTQTLYVKKEKE